MTTNAATTTNHIYLCRDGEATQIADLDDLDRNSVGDYGHDSILVCADGPEQALALAREYGASEEGADSCRWLDPVANAVGAMLEAEAMKRGWSMARTILDHGYDAECPLPILPVLDHAARGVERLWYTSPTVCESHQEIAASVQRGIVYPDGSIIVLCEVGAWSALDNKSERRVERVDLCEWAGLVEVECVIDDGGYPHALSALRAEGFGG